MAKLNGHIRLSKRQVRMIQKGREVPIVREGRRFILCLKGRSIEENKILSKMEQLRAELVALKAKRVEKEQVHA